jgi:hypothetical protein
MTLNITLILLGAGVGGALVSLWAGYLVTTRGLRKIRNKFVIGLGYALFLMSFAGSLLVLIRGLEVLEIPRRSSQRDVAVYAYVACLFCGVYLAVRSEARWRKSVGLGDKELMAMREKKN